MNLEYLSEINKDLEQQIIKTGKLNSRDSYSLLGSFEIAHKRIIVTVVKWGEKINYVVFVLLFLSGQNNFFLHSIA